MSKLLEKKNDILQLFDQIETESDLYYIALIVLGSYSKRTHTDIAELSLITDTDSLFNILKVYGGKTLYIPTVAEFKKFVLATSYFYYTEIKGFSRQQALTKLNCKNTKDFYLDLSRLKNIYTTLKVPQKVEDIK